MPKRLAQRIRDDFGLTAVIATEIEFYLRGEDELLSPDEVVALLFSACADAHIALASAEQERGPGQYEVALIPTSDITQCVSDTQRFKQVAKDAFHLRGLEVDFAAKPFLQSPGSGLHVHIHLEDAQGRNVFFRDEETFSPLLLHAIGGMLYLLNPCMVFFAPTADSFSRFAPKSNAPSTLSWGTNNRTVAIRLPTKPMDHKHIEHRVAGSDADIAVACAAILAGIHCGLAQQLDPGPPIYGDASLAQYALAPLVQNREAAERATKECAALAPYLADIQSASQGGYE